MGCEWREYGFLYLFDGFINNVGNEGCFYRIRKEVIYCKYEGIVYLM